MSEIAIYEKEPHPDEFGGRHVRVRGASKVMCHCMFGVLALTADQLVRLVT